jgi:basic membrane protein A and related proteins
VRKRSFVVLAIVAAAAIAAALVAGTGEAAKKATLKVALVTDIGGLNDRGFNQLANQGRLRAQAKLGADTRVFITQSASDRLPNIEAAATQGYQLVFGTGFFMGDGLDKVAPKFPNVAFAGIDVNWNTDLPSKPTNVRGLVFKEQEAGYLVGYIAGLVVKNAHQKVVSAIGANKVPAIVRYMAGYKAGAKKAFPGVKVLTDYANDPTFADQAKCKETSLNQIGRGTKVIFTIAGGCGLGALTAAKQHHLWGIGVDANQDYLGKFMLTSALKKVDVAVYKTVAAFKAKPSGFKGGYNQVFSLKNGGVGYAPLAKNVPHHAAITKAVNAIAKKIASGKIVPPAQ